MAVTDELTVEEVRRRLDYDPATGNFTWTGEGMPANTASRMKGKIVRGYVKSGYLIVRICGKQVRAHRLAVFWMTGEWPAEEADHENRDRLDNAWRNIRDASKSENMRNTIARADNSLGVKGVSKLKGRFVARLTVNGRQVLRRSFDNLEAARRAYRFASFWHHGSFGRTA